MVVDDRLGAVARPTHLRKREAPCAPIAQLRQSTLMSSPYRRDVSISFGGPLTPVVKKLILANLVVFVLQFLIEPLTLWLALHPPDVLPFRFQVWRVFTYMFVHGGLSHILFNMLFLFMLGCQLERHWGSRFFAQYYLLCGLGAALFAFIPVSAFFNAHHIGASGAVYGILLAYGLMFPRAKFYVFLTFPVEARYLVFIAGFVAFYGSISGSADGTSHIAHLGGLAAGFIILRWAGLQRRGSLSRASSSGGLSLASIREVYRRWRMKRLRKKFENYYEKRTGGGNDPDIIH